MMLAITMKAPLESRYGVDGYTGIRRALEAFAATADAVVIALDDDRDMSQLGVPTVIGSDPGSILACLRMVRKQMGESSSTLLVGGDDTIPFWRLRNPVTERSIDPDELVYTDGPYGTAADEFEEYMAPSIPVGRLTEWDSESAQCLIDLIDMATANREQHRRRSSSVAFVNADWLTVSKSAALSLPSPCDWLLSPGYKMDRPASSDSDRKCLYFNLHGFSDQADWKGYDPVRGQFITAVTPNAFHRDNVSGTIVFAENCYGAEIIGRTPNNSCALRLLKEGAVFIGASGLAYGSHITPTFILSDADELAKVFWTEYELGVGKALCSARKAFLGNSAPVDLDPFKRKTLLQFVLLGDPEWN